MFCLPCTLLFFFFFFNDTATTEIYTLSLHDALPISAQHGHAARRARASDAVQGQGAAPGERAGGALELPRAPGRRRAPVRGDPRARRRGPAPAPRAGAGDRAALERPGRRRVRPSRAAGAALRRRTRA